MELVGEVKDYPGGAPPGGEQHPGEGGGRREGGPHTPGTGKDQTFSFNNF